MSEKLIEQIKHMSDSEAVRFFRYFSDQLMDGAPDELDDIVKGIPPDIRHSEPVSILLSMPPEKEEALLGPDKSAAVAKMVLTELAKDKSIAGAMQESMAGYSDDELVAVTILALGVAISMMIIAATTRFQAKIGNVEIVKEAATPDQLSSIGKIAELLTAVAN